MESGPNSTVAAVLARCLVEPEFQRRLSADPRGTLREYNLSREIRSSFARFDFSKLELFGGLITQTQHNFLWETFPLSRALMKHYGVELTIFRSYRQRAESSTAKDLSRQTKIALFTSYLKDYLLRAGDGQCPGLLDILTHERICWELQGVAAQEDMAYEVTPAASRRARELDRLIPTFPRTVRSAEYRYNPLKIASVLEAKNFEPARLRRRLTRLFYRINPAACQLSVFEAAPAMWRVFRCVDGERSIGSILRAAGPRHPRREIRHYFEAACAGGLIELRWPR